MEGGKMKDYDVDSLFAQLDRVYVDRVVRNGFNDNSLYNEQELLKLDPEALNRLQEIISKTSNLKKPEKAGTIDITDNPNNSAKTKNGSDDDGDSKTSPEDDAQKQEERERRKKEREERDKRITILRGISLRIPLLIYGAELNDESTGITIDNFTSIVDDASWDEFMPRGVSKDDFNSFKIAYNPTVFIESGKRIRSLVREADNMPTDIRIQRIAEIFSYFHNPDKETVLTPWRVVNMHMSDCIGGFCFFNENFDGPNQKEIFDEATGITTIIDTSEPRFVSRDTVTTNIFADYNLNTLSLNSKILEINSKTGLYPLYVAYSLFRFRSAHFVEADLINNSQSLSIEQEQVIWDDIIRYNIFVICKTPMAKAITKRTLVGFRELKVQPNIQIENLNEQITTNKEELIAKIKSEGYWKSDNNNDKQMKFNAIVGNPPYQENISTATDNSSLSKQVFPSFIEIGVKLSPKFLSLITPSRWFTGDAQDKSFLKLRQFLKSNNSVSKIINYPNSKDIFKDVVIKGGVNYFLLEEKYSGKVNIINCNGRECISENRNLFEEDMDVIIINGYDYPLIKKVKNQNFSSLTLITTGRNAFDVIGKVSSLNKITKDKPFENCSKIRCKDNEIRYIESSIIQKNRDLFEKYKVFISKSAGDPNTDSKIIGLPYIGHPFEACTDSLITIGKFDNLTEANNLQKYIKTKFLRYLVAILKTSQNVTQIVYKFVPLQDFSEKSDIDWNKPITEIDIQLYAKYSFTENEINFIEKLIKPIE
jgi:hypothetical protein